MKKGLILFLILGILVQMFIWANSLLPLNESSVLSGLMTSYIHEILLYVGIQINIDDLSYIVRKLAHFSQFFIFGMIWFKVFTYRVRPFSLTLVYGALVATIDEGVQLFVDGRTGSLVDVLIDTSGVLFALLIWYIIITWINHYKTKSMI